MYACTKYSSRPQSHAVSNSLPKITNVFRFRLSLLLLLSISFPDSGSRHGSAACRRRISDTCVLAQVRLQIPVFRRAWGQI